MPRSAGEKQTQVQKFTMPIGEAFEKGQEAAGLRMAEDGRGVILYDHVLYEDDGPGAGGDTKWLRPEDRSPTEKVGGEVRVKKILVIDRPEALAGHLYICSGVKVTVNGQALPGGLTGSDYPVCPVELLKQGENEVVIEAPADQAVTIKVAARKDILHNAPERAGRRPRSFRSLDGGKTWEAIDGELLVRLALVQYVARGNLVSPVIDLAAGQGGGVLQPRLAAANVAVKTKSETPEGTGLKFFVRTGTSPAYEAGHWTTWEPAEAVKVPAGRRYLQWQAEFTTADAGKTPVLGQVTVEATVTKEAPPQWASGVKAGVAENAAFRYSSMPFEYEDPNSPKMRALRQKYKLDEVVAAGRTEFERLVLLRDWVSKQWPFQPPENRHYPAWNADEILTLKYGFCVQYAIVYMECATALGYQARFFFGNNYDTGHEVTEVWSNDFKKWIFMDAKDNWNHLDPRTGTPMSVLEIRDLILATYYQGKTAGPETRPKEFITSDLIATCYGTQFKPEAVDPKREKDGCGGKDGKFYVPPGLWVVLRFMPRNNFLSQPYPEPRVQGWSGWDYADFWSWDDCRNLPEYKYRHRTARRSDLGWTINEVRFDVAYGDRPDVLAVQMCTVTPYFETFLVNVDGQGWKPAERTVDWALHAGRNRLEMRVRNSSGVEGPVSFVEVERVGN
jgi:transglutaminase-like putative cysteine protease